MVKCENYSIYLEEGEDDAAFVHVLVSKWNKQVYKMLLTHLEDLVNVFEGEIYAFIPKGNAKLAKFSEMFGFYQIQEVKDEDGNVTGDVYGTFF